MVREKSGLAKYFSEKLDEVKREIFYHRELKALFYVLTVFLFSVVLIHFYQILFTEKAFSSGEKPDLRVTLKEEKKVSEIKPKRAAEKREEQIVVYVTGAVLKPGVYRLKKGSRIYDLFLLAQPTKESAAYLLNQAEILMDGEMIYVPTKEEASSFGLSPPTSGIKKADMDVNGNKKININFATAEELTKIPGIGEKTAEKIIAYREKRGRIKSLNELLEIEGIGEKKLEKIKEFITF